MAQTVRVSLPTYNALTDTDVRHYSLFADADNVLIKEFTRGSRTGTGNITHNLGYYPHFYGYGEVSSGRFQIMNGYNLFGNFYSEVDTTKLYLSTLLGASTVMKYYIFYDDIPS